VTTRTTASVDVGQLLELFPPEQPAAPGDTLGDLCAYTTRADRLAAILSKRRWRYLRDLLAAVDNDHGARWAEAHLAAYGVGVELDEAGA
jgi:hypothetical protein